MDKDNIPNLLKNRADLKMLTFKGLYRAIDALKSGEIEGISIGTNTNVSILTSYGIVTGTLISPMEQEDIQRNKVEIVVESIYKAVFNGRNDIISKLESDNPDLHLISDSSALLLKDAVINPYADFNNSIRLAYMLLFTDDIKGLSFGELSY